MNVAGAHHGIRPQPIPEHFGDAAGAENLTAPFVIAIDDGIERRRTTRAGEEQLLGREILLHGAVEIEMVARQIGKYRGVEFESVDAAERQRVGRNLHGGVGSAHLVQLGEEPAEIERFGGGVGGRQDARSGR